MLRYGVRFQGKSQVFPVVHSIFCYNVIFSFVFVRSHKEAPWLKLVICR